MHANKNQGGGKAYLIPNPSQPRNNSKEDKQRNQIRGTHGLFFFTESLDYECGERKKVARVRTQTQAQAVGERGEGGR